MTLLSKPDLSTETSFDNMLTFTVNYSLGTKECESISVRHFLDEQLSQKQFCQNLVDCVLSHTILKISYKNSV